MKEPLLWLRARDLRVRERLIRSSISGTRTMEVLIRPAKNVLGALRLPGDKSISHRYAMLGAFAEGVTELSNFSTGADCAGTLRCVEALGAGVDRTAEGVVRITGRAGKFVAPAGTLDCGNSGSTLRMLSGFLAGQDFACELSGDGSLSRRPMRRVIDPLAQMGAQIESRDGFPPLRIQGGKLRGIEYAMPVASAQVKSALLFAGLQANGETIVEEPVRTRDHSELALRAFGAEVSRNRTRIRIHGGQKLHAIQATVPSDLSSAAFFLCAAALFPESNLVFENLLMNPNRAALLDVLMNLGARVSVINMEEHHGELVGTVKVEHGKLRGIKISGALSAALIDELPVLAAIAPYTQEGIEIRDAQELRVKESDRIAAVARNLRAMSAQVEELEDGLRVPGGQQLRGAVIQSEGDHRIAMAFAIAALKAEGESQIQSAEAAAISFPEFFSILDQITER